MEKIKKFGLILPIIALIAAPFLVAAVDEPLPPPETGDTITTVGGLYDLLYKIVGWVQVFFFAIAILFIIFAAFQFLTSGGDAEKTGQAKTKLIYALVAIAVALLAFGAKGLIKSIIP